MHDSSAGESKVIMELVMDDGSGGEMKELGTEPEAESACMDNQEKSTAVELGSESEAACMDNREKSTAVSEEADLSSNTKQHRLSRESVDENSRSNQGKKIQLKGSDIPCRSCLPYPFRKYSSSHRYIMNSILITIESGVKDLIEPCHEYKGFINTTDCTEEDKYRKFIYETIRFGLACMNCRTNGTIHFGIGDDPHGAVLGVVVENTEKYEKELRSAIKTFIEPKYRQAVNRCVRPPRFVEVLNRDVTSSTTYVIEVDIVPDSNICKEEYYHCFNMDKKVKTKAKSETVNETTKKQFFVREGGNSIDLLKSITDNKNNCRYEIHVENMQQLSKQRREAERRNLYVTKPHSQGTALTEMITGGSFSLDESNFEYYVIETNKAHPSQCKSLEFLEEFNPSAVLDVDPESGNNGLSLITCHGGIEKMTPSDIDHQLMDKGASVRDIISFLCQKDVLPNKSFLAIFLLWSTVSDEKDPLVETINEFLKVLGGTDQILCICKNENSFISWRDLIEAQLRVDISDRCIYKLSLAAVNGTIRSLWSKNRRSIRFLPCGGGSRVVLTTEVECSLNTLDILCVNQCEGAVKDKNENFYKGGKVLWENLYLSGHHGSNFVKRNKTEYLIVKINQVWDSKRESCGLVNLIHEPGCGGTTLAMNTLWDCRKSFRCAVLKNNSADFDEVADQVVKLLTYDCGEDLPQVPVLLMIDDFDNMKIVNHLQKKIEEKCTSKNIKSTHVILLNCMRSSDQTATTKDTIFLRNNLSHEEQEQFTSNEIVKTFYEFMSSKNDLNPEYIQHVVSNTLRKPSDQKNVQLLALLSLFNIYCDGASLSVSLCQNFLGLPVETWCGCDNVQKSFGKLSNLICCVTVKGKSAEYKAVKIIHPKFAMCCLQEIETTYKMTKADITNLLLLTDELYESTEGKEQLLQDVYNILVGKCSKAHWIDWKFSVCLGFLGKEKKTKLIKDIENETPGMEVNILVNASKRFNNDANIAKLRHMMEKKRKKRRILNKLSCYPH